MEGLVKEIQRDILNGEELVNILRKTLVLSEKLGIQLLTEFLKKELNGYKKEDIIPDYRMIRGYRVEVWNPYHGWQIANFNDDESFEKVVKSGMYESISIIESLSMSTDGCIRVLPSEMMSKLFDYTSEYRVRIGRQQLGKIVDAVKNYILEECIKLEKEGIIGEGLSFTKKEKEKVKNINFYGPSSNTQIQIESHKSSQQQSNIGEYIKSVEILIGEVKKYDTYIDELADGEKIKQYLGEIKEEIEKNDTDENLVRGKVEALKSILVQTSGSIVSAGILKLLENLPF